MTATAPAVNAKDFLDATLRFNHPEKAPGLVRMGATVADLEAIVARSLQLSVEMLRQQRARLDAQMTAGALELLARDDVVDALDNLPFERGDVIVALGDSITDDVLSWAKQLAVLVERRRPELQLRVIDAGQSGDTTSDVIARLDIVRDLQPDWVLQLLGTNDARRHGSPDRQVFAAAESARNFETIRSILTTDRATRLVRMASPPILAERANSWPLFVQEGISWRNDEVRAVGEQLIEADAATIDLHAAMVEQASDLLGDDGVHPNLRGQQAILVEVLLALAKIARD